MNIIIFYVEIPCTCTSTADIDNHVEEFKTRVDLTESEKKQGNILKTIFVPIRNELGSSGTRVEVIKLDLENK